MDLLDSPLNLAHQQSRKAEKYLKATKWEEAIECHRKATDYLTQAMAATTIQQALESLSLQRESHIRQQAIIREKQRRAEKQQQERAATKPSSVSCSSSKTSSEDPASSSVSRTRAQEEVLLEKTMEECDSLLQFLNTRNKEPESLTKYLDIKRQQDSNVTVTNGVKIAKQDKEIVEELRVHNDALRCHLLDFMKEMEEQHRQVEYYQRELEFCRKENRELKDRLSKTEGPSSRHPPLSDSSHSDNLYSMSIGMNLDNLPALELPPLEVPKFDFSSLHSNIEEESVNGNTST